MQRPEDELIVVNRNTGEVIECSRRYILLDWFSFQILGWFLTYHDASQEQKKRPWKRTRVCLLLTETNE